MGESASGPVKRAPPLRLTGGQPRHAMGPRAAAGWAHSRASTGCGLGHRLVPEHDLRRRLAGGGAPIERSEGSKRVFLLLQAAKEVVVPEEVAKYNVRA